MTQIRTNGMNEENSLLSGLHSSKQYDQDLEWIRSKVLLMGGLVEIQLKDAMHAFEKGDVSLAEKIVAMDAQVNSEEIELDHACARLIVQRQPVANDLRNVMATVKVISSLERIGDEAVEIALSVKNIESQNHLLPDHYDAVINMSYTTQHMMREVLDAYARMDVTKAIDLLVKDDMVDDKFNNIMYILIQYMRENPKSIEASVNLLRAAKAVERIGDQIINIAGFIIYVVEGKDIRHTNSRLLSENLLR